MQRKHGGLVTASIAILFSFHLSGCATTPEPEALGDIVAVGDCLFIVFTHNESIPCLRREVDAKGEIQLPLYAKLHVAGMTLAQVEDAIPKQYVPCIQSWKPSVFKDPK